MHPISRFWWVTPGMAVMLLGAAALGCATAPTQQARKASPVGFLGDYSQLQAGAKGQALLRYVNPAVDFSRYDKISLDPVTVWVEASSSLADLPAEEVQALVDYLDNSLRERLARDFTLVDRPAPGAIRLRVAITEAEGSSAVMGTVSAVLPQMRLISGTKRLATGTAAFVGKAGVEAELLDSLTGERLAAAVDRRVGQTRVRTGAGTWEDVEESFDHWSEMLAARLQELRSKAAMERP